MKILINYATVSGNSAMLGQQLMDKLKVSHVNTEFVYKDADECKGEDYNQYELVIFASSTWDDGNINMIAQEYLDGLQNVQGKKFALIGLGDSSYPHFCGAVSKTEEKLKSLGVQLMGQAFKIDGFVEEAIVGKATEWATLIIGGLQPGQAGQTPSAQQPAGAPTAASVPTPLPQQPVVTPVPAPPAPAPIVTPPPVALQEELVAPVVPSAQPQATSSEDSLP